MSLRFRPLPALLLAALACERDPIRPPAPTAAPSFSQHEETGPPPSYSFGPDTRETGVFTGQEVSGQARLVCAAGGTCFDGYLESHVDQTLLDATLELPGSATSTCVPSGVQSAASTRDRRLRGVRSTVGGRWRNKVGWVDQVPAPAERIGDGGRERTSACAKGAFD
jgi:hypothetical protein